MPSQFEAQGTIGYALRLKNRRQDRSGHSIARIDDHSAIKLNAEPLRKEIALLLADILGNDFAHAAVRENEIPPGQQMYLYPRNIALHVL